MLGLWPNKAMDFSNLTAHGGFFPHGVGAIFAAIVVVIFSMVGAEIATIAAAESPDPGRAIAKATNSVITRIAIFFVGSIFLLAVILPWNSTELGALAVRHRLHRDGHPVRRPHHERRGADRGAVLPELGPLHRLADAVRAGRPREAPVGLITVSKRGVPRPAILASTVVGFLCVIAAAVSPDTVFLFLLNSSGAVILFVYLLIAVSQIVLRRRTRRTSSRSRCGCTRPCRSSSSWPSSPCWCRWPSTPMRASQLMLSLLAWAVVLVLFVATKRLRDRPSAAPVAAEPTAAGATRVLVLANETVEGAELLDELRGIDRAGKAEYFVCVPANPIDTGQAMHHGAVVHVGRHRQAAQERLDRTLAILRSEDLQRHGELGDYRPLRALAHAVRILPTRTGWSSAPTRRSGRPGCVTTWSTGPARRTRRCRSPTSSWSPPRWPCSHG